jgi:hypothetical protein
MSKVAIFIVISLFTVSSLLSQNVGIGTNLPTAKLEVMQGVKSAIKIRSLSLSDTSQLSFVNRTLSNFGTDFHLTNIREEGFRLSSTSDLMANNVPNIMHIKPTGEVGLNYNTPTDRLEVEGNVAIRNNAILHFGKGIVGKEVNAGKIGYGLFGYADALSIVGGGNSSGNRKIRLWAEGGTTLGGNGIVEGNLSVGTSSTPLGYRMSVDGKIIAEELRIQNSIVWPDYVFDTQYKLPTLDYIAAFINANHHLPDVPSAKEVEAQGIAVSEMQAVLLRKIEELTLLLIEQDKKITQLQSALKK